MEEEKCAEELCEAKNTPVTEENSVLAYRRYPDAVNRRVTKRVHKICVADNPNWEVVEGK